MTTETINKNVGAFPTDSCTEYVTCKDNVPNLKPCGEGLVFDPDQKVVFNAI